MVYRFKVLTILGIPQPNLRGLTIELSATRETT